MTCWRFRTRSVFRFAVADFSFRHPSVAAHALLNTTMMSSQFAFRHGAVHFFHVRHVFFIVIVAFVAFAFVTMLFFGLFAFMTFGMFLGFMFRLFFVFGFLFVLFLR